MSNDELVDDTDEANGGVIELPRKKSFNKPGDDELDLLIDLNDCCCSCSCCLMVELRRLQVLELRLKDNDEEAVVLLNSDDGDDDVSDDDRDDKPEDRGDVFSLS